jgi:hypothetical protein
MSEKMSEKMSEEMPVEVSEQIIKLLDKALADCNSARKRLRAAAKEMITEPVSLEVLHEALDGDKALGDAVDCINSVMIKI